MTKSKHVLVVASTFPASEQEPVPHFVKDQITAMKKYAPELRFTVLAPHNSASNKTYRRKHTSYTEYRFHYFFPRRFESITNQGILPALSQNKFKYLLVPLFVITEFFKLLRLTRELRPDIIYAHWFTPQAINASVVSKLTSVPFVFTTHASDVQVLKRLPFTRKIVRGVCTNASAYTAVSDGTAKKLEDFFDSEEWEDNFKKKLSIIPMGVRTKTAKVNQKSLEHVRRKLKLPDNVDYLLFLGRLVAKKGVSYLLEAYSLLPQNVANGLHLVIAGDGPLKKSLQIQAQKLHISNVTFTGYVQGDIKNALFSMSDFICLPSIVDSSGDTEGFPVVLMEALAAGKIVLASNTTGAEKFVVQGESGYIFKEKSATDLARFIVKVSTLDSNTRRIINRQSMKLAKQFDWTGVAKRHFQKLIEPAL